MPLPHLREAEAVAGPSASQAQEASPQVQRLQTSAETDQSLLADRGRAASHELLWSLAVRSAMSRPIAAARVSGQQWVWVFQWALLSSEAWVCAIEEVPCLQGTQALF